MRFFLSVLARVVTLAVPFVTLAAPDARAQTAQSAIVVILDDVGWEDVAAVPTPTLDALQFVGRRFDRAYSSCVCSPSRYQMAFGRFPHRDFIGTALTAKSAAPEDHGAPATRASVATVARAHGIRTGLFGKWHMNGLDFGARGEPPRVHGFETYRAGILGNLNGGEDHYNWTRYDDGARANETTYSTEAIETAFHDWWTATPGRKLGYLSFAAAHDPFDAPPASLLPPGYVVGPSNRERFLASIVALDTALARLAAYVDPCETLIIVVADNGTPANVWPPVPQSLGYKLTQYEGGIRVPMWVVGPGVTPAPSGSSGALVQFVDIPVTVLESLGITPATGFDDGISFVSELANAGPATTARPFAFVQRFAPNGGLATSLTRDDWAVIYANGDKALVQDGNPIEVYAGAFLPGFPHPLPDESLDIAGTPYGLTIEAQALTDRAAALGPAWPY